MISRIYNIIFFSKYSNNIYILRNILKILHLNLSGEALPFCQPRGDTSVILIDAYQGKLKGIYGCTTGDPPLGPLGRASSYECTHSSNRAALIESGHPWNAFSLLAHKTRQAPTTKPIHAHPWIGAKLRFIRYKEEVPLAGIVEKSWIDYISFHEKSSFYWDFKILIFL